MNQELATKVLEGEILSPVDCVRLRGSPHPWRVEIIDVLVPAGLTVAEMIEKHVPQTRIQRVLIVSLDGDPLLRENWHRIRPKKGTTITFIAVPGKGGGGGGGNNFIASALLIVVAIASLVFAPFLAGALGFQAGTIGFSIASGVIGAGITLAGTLAVTALFPPKSQKLTDDQDRPIYSIGGGRNPTLPYGTVPQVLGTHKMSPPNAAKPFTEIIGDDQYVRQLFCWGYGPVNHSSLKIGETPIGTYVGVEIEHRYGDPGDAPITLVPKEVFEETIGQELTTTPVIRVTPDNVDELSFDIAFNGGLYAIFLKDGRQLPVGAGVQMDYRVFGSGSGFTVGASLFFFESRKTPFRRGYRTVVPRGKYEFRVYRTSPPAQHSAANIIDRVDLLAMRSQRNDHPISFSKPLALTAIRIKATDQLNGIVDTFSGIVSNRMLAFNGNSWVPNQVSNNPANLFRFVLQGNANARPVPDSKIDIPTIQRWWIYNRDKGFRYNRVIERAQSVYNTLAEIAAAGRAVVVFKDGKWSVSWDEENLPVVQHFTTRNSWSFSSSIPYKQLPHGFRVRFLNELMDYKQDERTVYRDGYNQSNATLFELIDLAGITHPDLVWRHARFHIAQAIHRPQQYTLHTDFENLRCTRNDRVRVSHDVPLWGQKSARVKSVSGQVVTIDEVIQMESGNSYVARFRLVDGSSIVRPIVFNPGEHKSFVLDGNGPVPQAGDLMAGFGISDIETVVLRVLSIEPTKDLGAVITLVDDAPAISLADQGTIPPFSSNISLPPNPLTLAPQDIGYQEFVYLEDGEFFSGARVIWRINRVGITEKFEVQIRDDNVAGSDWRTVSIVSVPQNHAIVEDLYAGVFSFRVRALFSDNTSSDWSMLEHQNLLGLFAPPPNVTGFDIASIQDIATLSWDPITVANLSRYEIRYSPLLSGVTWGAATVIVPRATGSQTQVPNRVGTYLIKAVTRQDVYSSVEAIVTSSIAALENINVVEVLVESPSWAGVKDNTVIATGNLLQLARVDDVLAETGEYIFDNSIDLGAVYTSRITPRIVASGDTLSQNMSTWSSLSSVGALSSVDPDQWDVTVFYRSTNLSPSLNDWTEWKSVQITDVTARALQFKMVLTGNSSNQVTPSVLELSVSIDMPDRIEAGQNIIVPTSGLRIDFIPHYRSYTGIGLTIKDRQSGDREEVTNESETGFNIQFYNSSGSPVQRSINYVAKGYGRKES